MLKGTLSKVPGRRSPVNHREAPVNHRVVIIVYFNMQDILCSLQGKKVIIYDHFRKEHGMLL